MKRFERTNSEKNPHTNNFEGGILTGGFSGYFFMFMCCFLGGHFGPPKKYLPPPPPNSPIRHRHLQAPRPLPAFLLGFSIENRYPPRPPAPRTPPSPSPSRKKKSETSTKLLLREIILSSEGAERNSLPPMTVPDPSPVLDKNHPPMSP